MNSIYDLQDAVLSKDKELVAKISDSFRHNSRELYIALIQAITYSNDKNSLELEVNVEILKDLIEKCSGFSILELSSTSQKRELVLPRQVHMAMLHKTFGLSQSDSGKTYGKDHTTVIHGCKTVTNLYQTDKIFRYNYARVFDHCINFDTLNDSAKTINFLNGN